jgi:hypothetical protein
MPEHAVIPGLKDSTVQQFEMLQREILIDNDYFHHRSHVGPLDFHNAYDADEKHTLIRVDAVFTVGQTSFEVPAFAMQDNKKGEWSWRVRFRPPVVGSWTARLNVLCWHPGASSKEPRSAQRAGRDGTTYYEHEFHGAEQGFRVEEGTLPGPLELPEGADNRRYFYRRTKGHYGYSRQPFFVRGVGRPWNAPSENNNEWDAVIDRDKDLFRPMREAGCNALYHWLAPWESQLVHQASDEYWPKSDGSLSGQYPALKWDRRDPGRAYKRYDQGRALHTDQIFDLAATHDILIFLNVLSHQSLQDAQSAHTPHPWGEHGWGKIDRQRDSSTLNGFQLFEAPSALPDKSLTLRQFFEMDPDPASSDIWKRRLWNHFANFWRYVVARWTAKPALAAWVLIDELEGVGTSTDWWWKNGQVTGPWHNNLVALLKGKMRWKSEGKELSYTGDYLKHPLTVSTTHYEPDLGRASVPRSPAQAMEMIDHFGELPYHGTWRATPKSWLRQSTSPEPIDFMSHHVYQAVPTWGQWPLTRGSPEHRRYKVSRDELGQPVFKGWCLPNSIGTEHIDTNRWLWDSLCVRLHSWVNAQDPETSGSVAPIQMPKLVTEYGCWERNKPDQRWDYFGPRNPSFTHFANWAALVVGHAGVPFKWNDAKNFGEMIGRPSPTRVWERSRQYPVNNYVEMSNISKFLGHTTLTGLAPTDLRVVGANDKPDDTFNAWALTDQAQTIWLVWIYRRTFSGFVAGRRLKVEGLSPHRLYVYDWFNTWDGKYISGIAGTVVPDKQGVVRLGLPPFPPASDEPKGRKATVRVAEGNDIALRLTVIGGPGPF